MDELHIDDMILPPDKNEDTINSENKVIEEKAMQKKEYPAE